MPDLRRLGLPGVQAIGLGGAVPVRPGASGGAAAGGADPEIWSGFAFGLGLTGSR